MKNFKMMQVLLAVVTAAVLSSSQLAMAKININTASLRRLERLPGVGRDIAEQIINYRKQIGSFRTLSELKDVPGIGERKLEAIEGVATVGALSEHRD